MHFTKSFTRRNYDIDGSGLDRDQDTDGSFRTLSGLDTNNRRRTNV